jgi:hypothetical protein
VSKYDPWTAHLRSLARGEVMLSIQELQALVPDMASSAAVDNRWWINRDPSHSHCRSWNDAGYDAHPDLDHSRIIFRPTVGEPVR